MLTVCTWNFPTADFLHVAHQLYRQKDQQRSSRRKFQAFLHFLTFIGWCVLITLCLTIVATSRRLWPRQAAQSQCTELPLRRGGLIRGDDRYMMAYQQNRPESKKLFNDPSLPNDASQIQHASLLYNTLISSSVNPVRSHLSWTSHLVGVGTPGKKFLVVRLISLEDVHGWVSHRLMLDSSTI